MVIHDSDQQQRWTEQQQQTRQRKPEKKRRGPISVTAVQSLACCCLVLLALLFRLAGGDGYEQLRQRFYKAMQGNQWASVLADWLEDTTQSESSAPKSDDKADNFTPSSNLQTQGVTVTPNDLSDA